VKSSLSLVPSYRQNIIALLEIRWDWYNTTHCKEGLQKHIVKYLTSDDYHYEAILLTFKEVIETLKDNAWEDVIDDIIYESIIDCKQPLKWAKH
jgi:hypothetical protein